MLAGDLQKAELPAIFAPNQLVISFSSVYNSQYQACSDPLRMKRVEDALARVTGQTWNLRFELRDLGPAEAVPQQVEITPALDPHNEPLVEKVMGTLSAKLLKVDEGFGHVQSSRPAIDDDEEAWPSTEEE
jgi:hypothetical protein